MAKFHVLLWNVSWNLNLHELEHKFGITKCPQSLVAVSVSPGVGRRCAAAAAMTQSSWDSSQGRAGYIFLQNGDFNPLASSEVTFGGMLEADSSQETC